MPYRASRAGWNNNAQILKKSTATNKLLECDTINQILYNKLHDAKSLINELGSADWHHYAIKDFIRFNNNKNFPLDQLSVSILKDFEVYKESKGLKPNGINSHIRTLRALFNAGLYKDKIDVSMLTGQKMQTLSAFRINHI